MQTSRRTCSSRSLTWSSARSRCAERAGLVHARCRRARSRRRPRSPRRCSAGRPATAAAAAGARRPGSTRSPRPSSRLRGLGHRLAHAGVGRYCPEHGRRAAPHRRPTPSVAAYFERSAHHDLDAIAARGRRTASTHRAARPTRTAPDGVRAYFERALRRVPRPALRGARTCRRGRPGGRALGGQRARSPGRPFQGVEPTCARLDLAGLDSSRSATA